MSSSVSRITSLALVSKMASRLAFSNSFLCWARSFSNSWWCAAFSSLMSDCRVITREVSRNFNSSASELAAPETCKASSFNFLISFTCESLSELSSSANFLLESSSSVWSCFTRVDSSSRLISQEDNLSSTLALSFRASWFLFPSLSTLFISWTIWVTRALSSSSCRSSSLAFSLSSPTASSNSLMYLIDSSITSKMLYFSLSKSLALFTKLSRVTLSSFSLWVRLFSTPSIHSAVSCSTASLLANSSASSMTFSSLAISLEFLSLAKSSYFLIFSSASVNFFLTSSTLSLSSLSLLWSSAARSFSSTSKSSSFSSAAANLSLLSSSSSCSSRIFFSRSAEFFDTNSLAFNS